MPDRVLLVMAFEGDKPVAGALNLIGSQALFGRNWGCAWGLNVKFLHFELCYYQVTFCLAGWNDKGAASPYAACLSVSMYPFHSISQDVAVLDSEHGLYTQSLLSLENGEYQPDTRLDLSRGQLHHIECY